MQLFFDAIMIVYLGLFSFKVYGKLKRLVQIVKINDDLVRLLNIDYTQIDNTQRNILFKFEAMEKIWSEVIHAEKEKQNNEQYKL